MSNDTTSPTTTSTTSTTDASSGTSGSTAGVAVIDAMPETRVDEIADGIYRISTLIPDIAPGGFSFNQFLILGEEPLLFHTGPRAMFPLVSEAVARVIPVESVRWITFGHVESDECGSMNMWLAAAPRSSVAHGALGCDVSLNDMCDRPPLALEEGQVLDIGGKRLRQISTPHIPHGWEAQVLFEETTGTLLCGDLFSHVGGGPAIVDTDVVGPALATERIFGTSSLTPTTSATLRMLAALQPSRLAVMHGSSFCGDVGRAFEELTLGLEEIAAER